MKEVKTGQHTVSTDYGSCSRNNGSNGNSTEDEDNVKSDVQVNTYKNSSVRVRGVQTKRSGPQFCEQEAYYLACAWIEQSREFVQESESFWRNVHKRFTASGMNNRTCHSLKSKWKTLAKECQLWNACMSRVRSMYMTGNFTEDALDKMAMSLWQSRKRSQVMHEGGNKTVQKGPKKSVKIPTPFKYIDAAKYLSKFPKFEAHMDGMGGISVDMNKRDKRNVEPSGENRVRTMEAVILKDNDESAPSVTSEDILKRSTGTESGGNIKHDRCNGEEGQVCAAGSNVPTGSEVPDNDEEDDLSGKESGVETRTALRSEKIDPTVQRKSRSADVIDVDDVSEVMKTERPHGIKYYKREKKECTKDGKIAALTSEILHEVRASNSIMKEMNDRQMESGRTQSLGILLAGLDRNGKRYEKVMKKLYKDVMSSDDE